MQYVKQKVNKSGSLSTRESHECTLCSQSRDNLSTHIFNMGSDAVAASRDFLIAKNPPTCESGLLCKTVKILTAPNHKLSSRSKQICNFSSATAIDENYFLKLPLAKIPASENLLTIAPTVNLGQSALYTSRLVTGPFRLAAHSPKIFIEKWFIDLKFCLALFRAHINIYQAFSPYLRLIPYRRLLIFPVPVPRD